jgi:ElaB/YqjD/DUF883 family membrane-anchored ribosome-binding protein
MSILNGMTTMITQLKSSIDSEKDRLERDLSSSIRNIVTGTTKEFSDMFDDLREGMKDVEQFVEKDFVAMEKLLDKVVKKIESTAEKEYHGFEKKVDTVITDIENSGKSAIAGVEEATEYIRTKAYQDFDAAITLARKDFDAARDFFRNEIESLASSLVSKTKSGIRLIVSDAKDDLEKVNTLRKNIDDELKSKVEEIGHEISHVKDKAMSDLDRMIGFMRKEMVALETKVKALKSDLKTTSTYVAGTAVVASAAIGFMMYAYSKTYAPEIQAPPASSNNSNNARNLTPVYQPRARARTNSNDE